MQYLQFMMISLGGVLGANARFLLGKWIDSRTSPTSAFPWGTFCINISGSLLLGLFMTLFARHRWSDNWRLFFAVGFLGAYTTFSTFEYDSIRLWMEGRADLALKNLIGSVGVGLFGVWLGVRCARLLLR